ncbi:MAG: SNF2-related protein [Thermomicrobiales bacterium]
MALTDYHAAWLAHSLTRRYPAGSAERLTGALIDAQVDLNPHQIEAALFAFRSPLSAGALLADEVGLGKTIEAGLVISQMWAERKGRILVITPANLRKQWLQELTEKFFLPCHILEAKAYTDAFKQGKFRPFEQNTVVICSYQFARSKASDVHAVPWDLVVIDEAHRLRNVYKANNVIAQTLKLALAGRKKLLLTATPLQNSLLELYGLVSFIDDYAFGDVDSFREQYSSVRQQAVFAQLRERLQPVCHRTLRRQVLPYVRYTKRLPLVQPFTPDDDEFQLYGLVSEYLQRPNLQALPSGQRALMTLVLRKLLASSTFAIAGALETMTRRLEASLGPVADEAPALADALDADYEALRETADEWDAPEAPEPLSAGQREAVAAEVKELRAFSALALSIEENAKGRALLLALERAFAEAARLGAARKAIIFTESRKTQEYLLRLLAHSEFGEGIVLFNGSNTDARSREIYAAWLKRHQGSDRVTGSRTADMRSALVDYFRDEGRIMIATEAGAEGINLQFCSLVVNYDLPWNPQRIEQRIGRCHRYGQQHDVVVVNFLNQTNAADQRVFELLSEKFQLFEGVFGASDDVLGIAESGVDFEQRIAAIYQQCRTPEQIGHAFDALQRELEGEISEAIRDTRQQLLDHFDVEVTEKLRLRDESARAALDRSERMLLRLTEHELADAAEFTPSGFTLRRNPFPAPVPPVPLGRYELPRREGEAHFYRLTHPLAEAVLAQATARHLPCAAVTFDYGAYLRDPERQGRMAALEPFIGQSGWLRLALLRVDGPESAEDHLLAAAVTDDGAPLPADASRFFSIPAWVDGPARAAEAPAALGAGIAAQAAQIAQDIAARNMAWLDEESRKLDAWADDQRLSARRAMNELESEMKALRKAVRGAGAMPERLAAQRALNGAEARHDEAELAFRAASREVRARRDALLDDVEARLAQATVLTDRFTIRWRLV